MALRTYSIVFQNISVAAVQDLLSLYCGASMGVELHGINIGQVTGITQQNLNISVVRLPATVTSGAGGGAVTPRRANPNDAAATATARRNDTTQATSTGTVEVLYADVLNTLNGMMFFWPPDDRPKAGLSQALILRLDTAPTAAMSVSGSLLFGELL